MNFIKLFPAAFFTALVLCNISVAEPEPTAPSLNNLVGTPQINPCLRLQTGTFCLYGTVKITFGQFVTPIGCQLITLTYVPQNVDQAQGPAIGSQIVKLTGVENPSPIQKEISCQYRISTDFFGDQHSAQLQFRYELGNTSYVSEVYTVQEPQRAKKPLIQEPQHPKKPLPYLKKDYVIQFSNYDL